MMTYPPPGWRNYYNDYTAPGQDTPNSYKQIEIWRPEWEKPSVVNPLEMNPAMNIIGLYWRPRD